MDLTGRRVLVVGASAGIGREFATQAVQAGARVVFSARRLDVLQAAVAEAGGGHAVAGDVRTADGQAAIAAGAAAALGQIDLLLYATGMSPLRALKDTSNDEWATVFGTNVVGASMTTAACLPHLAPNAVCAYLSSDSAVKPRFALVAYAASKSALETLVVGWRMEHPEFRFTTVVVGPTTGTEFANDFDPTVAGAALPAWFARGDMQINLMPKPQLVGAMLQALGAALANPDVDINHLTLRPPGPLAASMDEYIVKMMENLSPG